MGYIGVGEIKDLIKEKKIKLNLGCGNDFKEGFLNVDRVDFSIVPQGVLYYKSDILTLLKNLPGGSVCQVLANYFIEHLDYKDVSYFFYLVWKILVVGGTFEFVVPDFDVIIKKYQDGELDLNYATLELCSEGEDRHGALIDKNMIEKNCRNEHFKIEGFRSGIGYRRVGMYFRVIKEDIGMGEIEIKERRIKDVS